MRINILGGGPAGLYLGTLLKKQNAAHDVRILERNRPGETFGFGVVFSDQTLENLEAADPESMAAIRARFARWEDIDTWYSPDAPGQAGARAGTWTRSTGHGFCGLARVELLKILERRAREVGCRLEQEREVADPEALRDADVLVGADGINSRVRARYAETFRPEIDLRPCRFLWLGTTLPLAAFTFLFGQTAHGLFQIHAYPYQRDPDPALSTFIVECQEDVWQRAGLGRMDEQQTLDFLSTLFAPHLKGHPLLIRNSGGWRRFPVIRCARWHHENVVILGDAAHTAHFSIGSGTKLAMEDAILLAKALGRDGGVPERLAAYEAERRPEVDRIQHAARTSMEWFENTARYLHQTPAQFNFNLMTRSKRITYDNLLIRDRELTEQVTAELGAAGAAVGAAPVPPAFLPFRLRGLTLPNRIVVSPMCQYRAADGLINDWHLVHLGSRAIGGAGLILTEATAVSPEGRITPGCAGMYRLEHRDAWRRVVDFVHGSSGAKIGLQLAHAGRKGARTVPWEGDLPLPPAAAWELLAPSAIPWDADAATPRAMAAADLLKLEQDFVRSAQWAAEAGFDWLELHMAHGYLLSTFLSALTNRRADDFGGGPGGDLSGRLRLPVRLVQAVRAVWPADRPISVRISATEWAPDSDNKSGAGMSDADRAEIARALVAAGADIIDCSHGGVIPDQRPVYGRMFGVPFSDQIRNEAGVPTMAVGNIQDADQINTILAAGRADLCLLARAHLTDPYLGLHAAAKYGVDARWPEPYLAVKPGRRKGA